jgi:hypothetical protein
MEPEVLVSVELTAEVRAGHRCEQVFVLEHRVPFLPALAESQ